MYTVIRVKKEFAEKLVRPYEGMERFSTLEEANHAIKTKPSAKDLEKYDFTVVETKILMGEAA